MGFLTDFAQDYVTLALEAVVIVLLVAKILVWWEERKQRRMAIPASRLLELTDSLRDIQGRLTDAYACIEKAILGQIEAIDTLEDRISSLKNQKTVSELTPEQEKAIAALFRRARTAREILSSRDFWAGRVLTGALFFSLGMLVEIWRSR